MYCTAELSQSIVPSHTSSRHSSASSSPRIPIQRLSISDDGSPGQQPARSSGSSSRSYSSYPEQGRSASPAMQARTASDSAYRPASHPPYPAYGHPSAMMPRHIDPNALATSGYPYAASQPLPTYPHQGPQPGQGSRGTDSLSAERPSTAPGRYECSWCGKGFTRPSSLKVSRLSPSVMGILKS